MRQSKILSTKSINSMPSDHKYIEEMIITIELMQIFGVSERKIDLLLRRVIKK